MSLTIQMEASKLCIHDDCFGSVNYCEERYSYVTVIDPQHIDSTRYLVPVNAIQTETFKGKCYTISQSQ
ncbi:hypothetical protein MVEG_05938 [Podila verticillata NRRL 6337]|nr:hypothetical protein MVEG_05938 [Podila verticillata NRRL 6337]